MTKDIFKLIILLVVVAAIILGIYFFGKTIDNKKKYQHPITRPGGGW